LKPADADSSVMPDGSIFSTFDESWGLALIFCEIGFGVLSAVEVLLLPVVVPVVVPLPVLVPVLPLPVVVPVLLPVPVPVVELSPPVVVLPPEVVLAVGEVDVLCGLPWPVAPPSFGLPCVVVCFGAAPCVVVDVVGGWP
jgi:hypothetical protein